MKITVYKQTKRFYLAFDRWVPAVGHEIKVGKYRFCAIAANGAVNVSEVTSGVKVFEIPFNPIMMAMVATKEDTLFFYENVLGQRLLEIIQRTPYFDEFIRKARETAISKLGEMPAVENVDTEWLEADVSEILN